jgi:hypothetical protein
LPKAWRKLIEVKVTSQPHPESQISTGERNATLASLAGSMRHHGMTRQAIEAALLEDNVRRCDPPLPASEVFAIARSISLYPPGGAEMFSVSSTEEGEAETINLKFRTGKQIADEVPPDVLWVVKPYVALGAITEIDGKVKLAGKTTFTTHLVHATLDGSPFLGEPTEKKKVVYLTEQPITSFRVAIERAGLLGRKDLTVLLWSETHGIPWHKVAQAAVEECKHRGAKLLVVDTLPQFAGLIEQFLKVSGQPAYFTFWHDGPYAHRNRGRFNRPGLSAREQDNWHARQHRL